MNHDRVHAREPSHQVDQWTVGTIESIGERDGHCVVTVQPPAGDSVELVVTFAVRDLFLGRLDVDDDDDDESPVGERVWYRQRGE